MILSGPSGAGKDTLAQEMIKHFGGIVEKVVTYTTRPKRPGEKNHHDYHFVSVKDFKAMVKSSFFLEWARVHGHLYGSPWKSLDKPLQEGKTVLLVLDTQGGLIVKEKYPLAVLVFILPSQWEILRERMWKRSLNKKEGALRFRNAHQEVQALPKYDYLVVNDDLTQATQDLIGILRAEYCKTFRRVNRLPLSILK